MKFVNPFPGQNRKKFAALKKSFSVTGIIYLSGRRHYGKRHVRRRNTRMGQERKGVPESPGGHRRQPARRRHPGRAHRLLPVVHVPAGKHRHRRRARHGMPGQRHGPVQGKLHPRRGAGIELPASLRHRLRQGRLHRHPERKREALKSKDPVGEASPCLQPRLRSLSLPKGRVFRTPPLRADSTWQLVA